MPLMLLLFLTVLMRASTYLTPFGCLAFMGITSAACRTGNILFEFWMNFAWLG
jgi:hypothetical protein